MTPPPARRRRTGAQGSAPAHNLPRRGTVRRAQAITTYGIGSLIAVDSESFVVSGLDEADQSWSVNESPRIHERRLARLLDVDYFRLPPASDDKSKDGLRVRRFPLMHSCPECNDLQRHRDFNPPPVAASAARARSTSSPPASSSPVKPGTSASSRTGSGCTVPRTAVPQRPGSAGEAQDAHFRAHVLAPLDPHFLHLWASPRGLDGGLLPQERAQGSGPQVPGHSPVARHVRPRTGVRTPLRTLQRGSSAVWQPVLKSALSIPPWSDGRADPLAEHWEELRKLDSRAEVEMCLKFAFKGASPVPIDEVMELLDAEREDSDGESEPTFDHRYRALRNKEYERLHSGNDESEHSHKEQFVCETPLGDQSVLGPLGVTGPMLVKRLREVRALKAFTRLADPDSTTESKEMPLSSSPLRWLPAMEVRGEGVFLRLDNDRLGTWEKAIEVAARVERMRTAHQRVLEQRAGDPSSVVPSPATPRMVLLHTLAHVLINEWSLDAGYPAASLRERLYAADDMAGVLIYTATSDSAGSLGGLVAQGEPERLDQAIRSAVHRAAWCSSDPLCVESEASGTGGTNLAACHACVMLPETSCEQNNILLDRALLVGTPDNPHLGFFANVLEQ